MLFVKDFHYISNIKPADFCGLTHLNIKNRAAKEWN
jgi:hypothetical protein